MQTSIFNFVDGKVKFQSCTACALADTPNLKTNCMNGIGPAPAEIMFVGSAPMSEDDQVGNPMTGRGGRSFHEVLAEAGINSDQCYVTNTIKCFPGYAPGGKVNDIKDKHWEACSKHFLKELELVNPKVIVAVGAQALSRLCGESGIARLRKHILTCSLNSNFIVVPILQPGQLNHTEDKAKDRVRSNIVEDLRWIKSKLESGQLNKLTDLDLDYKMANHMMDVKDFIAELMQYDILSVDLECCKKDFSSGALIPGPDMAIQFIQFSGKPGHARAIPLYTSGSYSPTFWTSEDLATVKELIRPLLKKQIIGFNWTQFDQKWIAAEFDIEQTNIIFDGHYAHYILDPDHKTHSLKDVVKIYAPEIPAWKMNYDVRDNKKLATYGCVDVDAVYRTTSAMWNNMSPKQQELLQTLVIPLGHELNRMERRGVLIDQAALADLERELSTALKKDLQSLRVMPEVQAFEMNTNQQFSPDAPQQIGELLEKYFRYPNLQRTASGKIATSAAVLESLSRYPFVQDVLHHRKLAKLSGTYVTGLKERLRNGRIHTSFKIPGTVTGRLASEDPNLQNLPRSDTAGRVLADPDAIKKMFVADPGYIWLQADYSQAELRTLAMLCHDPGLLAIYNSGGDLHIISAAKAFGIDPLDVTKAQRTAAKGINFGIIYGRSLETISIEIQNNYVKMWKKGEIFKGRTEDFVMAQAFRDARAFWDGHKKEFPFVWKFMEDQEKIIATQGYQETLTGRRRYYEYIDADAKRAAYNFPVQSLASDFTQFSIVRSAQALRALGLDAYPVLTVHDSIVFQVKIEQLHIAARTIKYIMENLNFSFMSVPMIVDLEIGSSWGAMEHYQAA